VEKIVVVVVVRISRPRAPVEYTNDNFIVTSPTKVCCEIVNDEFVVVNRQQIHHKFLNKVFCATTVVLNSPLSL
jgi:hypothetical protein